MLQKRSTKVVLLLALGLTVLLRVPFLFHNPDWGPKLYDAHCFLFSAAEIHADRRAIDPDTPFWVVCPDQIRNHYHRGAAFMMYAVKVMVAASGIRSMALIKLLGILYTGIFAVAMTWVLRRYSTARPPVVWLAPLVVTALPPVFFLWVTLFPQGHYFETHLFWALYLPFMIVLVERRLGPRTLVGLGLVTGAAMAFVVTNAVFQIAILLGYLFDERRSAGLPSRAAWYSGLPSRLFWCGASAGLAAVVFRLLSSPHALAERAEQTETDVATGLLTLLSGDLDYLRQDLDVGFAWIQHIDLLFGVANRGFVGTEVAPYSLALGHVLLALFLGAGVFGVWHAVANLVRPAAYRSSRLRRFIGLNGLLNVGFLLTYLALGAGVGEASIYNAFYVVPCYTPAIVCVGAFLASLTSHRLAAVRIAGRALALLSAGVLVASWITSYRAMAIPRFWPEDCVCDARWFEGYFLDAGDEVMMLPDGSTHEVTGANFNLEGGIQRCSRSRPDSEQACVYMGYLLKKRLVGDVTRCEDAPREQQAICARAQAAADHGCAPATGMKEDADVRQCQDMEGELRAACLTGAHHGHPISSSMMHCMGMYRSECEAIEDGPTRSMCREQLAWFARFDTASFPEAPADMPAVCESFVEPWQGLCARSHILALERGADDDAPYCEDVYVERYLHELPEQGGLNFDICLTASRVDYPWCAIGIARHRGDTDCRWKGEPEPFGRAPYLPPP